MSAAALLLQFIFAFLGFLISLQGLFALLVGLVMFIALPIVPKAAGEFKRLANLHLWLATSLVSRAAIVVSEHGDIYFKRMQFDDLGVEKIKMGDEMKEFEDPDASLHYWFGIPFAMADEESGVLFDPRHAALGARKQEAVEKSEQTIRATQEEWDAYGVHAWKRGVYQFKQGVHELVDLTKVKHIIDGGERGEYPTRVETLYQHSRAPFQEGTSATRFILVLVALLAPFAGMWLLATQGSSGGGGGGGTTVSPGSSFLALLISAAGLNQKVRTVVKSIDWKFAGKALAVGLPLPVVFLLLFIFVNPLMAIFAYIAMGIGFWFLPIMSAILGISSFLAGGLSKFYLKLGLLGYDRPVWNWTPESYRLVEADDLEDIDEDNTTWYSLAGALVGFSFDPFPENWGAAAADRETLERNMVADGGTTPETDVPKQFRRLPDRKRASTYAAFVPKRLKRGYYYVRSGIAMGWFSDSADGEKSLQRLLWAKEKYGGDNGLSDRTLIYAMVGCGLISLVSGILVFFVL